MVGKKLVVKSICQTMKVCLSFFTTKSGQSRPRLTGRLDEQENVPFCKGDGGGTARPLADRGISMISICYIHSELCLFLAKGYCIMGGMKIGYARVSTDDQNLDLQRQALTGAGCELVFEDEGISGTVNRRAGLRQALERVQAGDSLIVWRLDRLGRSLAHLIQVIDGIGKKGAGFVSLCEAIDTGSAGGRLVFHLMGALAEFERELISERTRAGMKAARRRGAHLGRPRKLTAAQIDHAREMIEGGRFPTAHMARLYGVDPSTLWRALQRQDVRGEAPPCH